MALVHRLGCAGFVQQHAPPRKHRILLPALEGRNAILHTYNRRRRTPQPPPCIHLLLHTARERRTRGPWVLTCKRMYKSSKWYIARRIDITRPTTNTTVPRRKSSMFAVYRASTHDLANGTPL